jgi:hypothetical protein
VKAIVITSKNQTSIATDYGVDIEDADELLPLGWVLVASFADERYDGVIPQATLDNMFTRGATLQNDYFEIIPK